MIIAHCTSRALYNLQTKPRNEYCRVVLKHKAAVENLVSEPYLWHWNTEKEIALWKCQLHTERNAYSQFLAVISARSTTRWLYPHSLSYHATTCKSTGRNVQQVQQTWWAPQHRHIVTLATCDRTERM